MKEGGTKLERIKLEQGCSRVGLIAVLTFAGVNSLLVRVCVLFARGSSLLVRVGGRFAGVCGRFDGPGEAEWVFCMLYINPLYAL